MIRWSGAFQTLQSTLLGGGLSTYTPQAPVALGNPADRPIPSLADLNGDGRLDLIVYDPVTGAFVSRAASTAGTNIYLAATTTPLGIPNDRPLPAIADLNSDGRLDLTVFDPVTGSENIRLALGGLLQRRLRQPDDPSPGPHPAVGPSVCPAAGR